MIVIIDYGIGNTASVMHGLEKVSSEEVVVSDDPADIEVASHIVLPGVGSFSPAVSMLRARQLVEPLYSAVHERNAPVLGICLGMHLLGEQSEEGEGAGLDLLSMRTKRFSVGQTGEVTKVPHMGWNTVACISKDNQLFANIRPRECFYFAHSYYPVCNNLSSEQAHTEHEVVFPSVVQDGVVVGVQFHPEKSHTAGLQLLQNFLAM